MGKRDTWGNGILALDVNAHPYHLAPALVAPDGNLKRHLTLFLEGVERTQGQGAKELHLKTSCF